MQRTIFFKTTRPTAFTKLKILWTRHWATDKCQLFHTLASNCKASISAFTSPRRRYSVAILCRGTRSDMSCIKHRLYIWMAECCLPCKLVQPFACKIRITITTYIYSRSKWSHQIQLISDLKQHNAKLVFYYEHFWCILFGGQWRHPSNLYIHAASCHQWQH